MGKKKKKKKAKAKSCEKGSKKKNKHGYNEQPAFSSHDTGNSDDENQPDGWWGGTYGM